MHFYAWNVRAMHKKVKCSPSRAGGWNPDNVSACKTYAGAKISLTFPYHTVASAIVKSDAIIWAHSSSGPPFFVAVSVS